MIKKLATVITLISVIIGITSYATQRSVRYEAEFLKLFDTITKIVAYTNSKDNFTKSSQLIYDKLKEYHELYDIYNDYEGISNIKTINDNAGVSPVKVDRKIIDLLLFAKEANYKTNGKINVAFGSVLKLWHDHREEGIDNPQNASVPSTEQLKEASEHTDINNIIINEIDSTIYLCDPLMKLDVGAIAKGYAVEKVSQYAMQNEFCNGIISVGGNVRTIGKKGKDKPWNVGIQNPDTKSEQANLMIAYLSEKSLVTSGDYERYYAVNGKRYHHIIDPNTLFPADFFASVSIICQDSGFADALSTAVFNMPFDQGFTFIESLPDVDALWVFHNGEIKYSSHFKDYLKEENSL